VAELKLININKIFPNGFHAVKDTNLSIEDKEFMVLVGPSGCGKTTTLRMIAGLEDITSGELHIGDRMVNEIPPKDRDIAMVFQNYALYPHMTVYDNMAFGLKLRKIPKLEIDKQVKNVAEILGISELLDRKPKQLSGGQRQRVALGRAIVRDPKVFLMDEPLSNLDAKLRVQMRSELIKLHNKLATTFVYVTHDQTEAMTMGTRICVINKGLVQQVADPNTIYENPVNKFVASFIGAPQMNFINTMVKQKGLEIILSFYDHELVLPEDKAEKMKDYIGKEVILGIRPESVNTDPKGLVMSVEVTEHLGSETYLYLIKGDQHITARVKPDINLKIGDETSVSFNVENIHLFDMEDEKSLFYQE
jgi:multiple sugar transport system ATP-binding protein